MPDYFPAFLDLRERPCLVVGGGAIGERKVRELLDGPASHARVADAGGRNRRAAAVRRWPETFADLELPFGPEYAELVEQAGRTRRALRASARTPEARVRASERVMAAAMAGAAYFTGRERELT